MQFQFFPHLSLIIHILDPKHRLTKENPFLLGKNNLQNFVSVGFALFSYRLSSIRIPFFLSMYAVFVFEL
jgi:hypothetical protein